MKETTTKFCSYDMSWDNSGVCNSDCWHFNAIKGNGEMMEKVWDIIASGFDDEGSQYFGNMVMDIDICTGPNKISVMIKGMERCRLM